MTLTACANKSGDTFSSFISPTIYYRPVIHLEQEKCSAKDRQGLKDPEGKILVNMCESSYQKCLTQGSCLVISKGRERSLGYNSNRGGEPRFVEVNSEECPFGRGVQDHLCLDPYFSVAADLGLYKVGDVIYVDVLRGVKMPDGQVHDGYLIIRDEGGGVKGPTRFDFFTGYLHYTDKANTLAQLGLGDPDNRIHFQLVTGDTAETVRKRRNYPGIPHAVKALAQAQVLSRP